MGSLSANMAFVKLTTQRRREVLIALAVVAGVGARLVLAFGWHGNHDQDSYEIVASIMRSGGNVYAETARYNYSPIWAYGLLALSNLASWTGLPFHFVVRGFLTAVDFANAVLIGRLGAREKGWHRHTGMAIYLVNPVAILLVGYHGQFETLAMLPLLIAANLLTAHGENASSKTIWALATLALTIKHIVIFFVWTAFLTRAKSTYHALVWSLAAAAVFLASLLPFAVSGGADGIIRNVLLYSSRLGVWGLSAVLPVPIAYLFFVITMAIMPVAFAKRIGPLSIRVMEAVGVAFLALIPGFGVQYLLLPIILGSALASRPYLLYSVVASMYILADRDSLAIGWLPNSAVLVWLTLLIWLASCIRNMLAIQRSARACVPLGR